MDDQLVAVRPDGKVYPAWAYEAVEKLLEKIRGKNMWEVVSFLVEVYEKRDPEGTKKRQEAMAQRRKNLKNRWGANKRKDMRHLVSIPADLKDLMSFFLTDFDNVDFWRQFAKRYPQYSVPERENI